MTIKELLDKIKCHNCEQGIFKVFLMAAGHLQGYDAWVVFRSTKPDLSTHGDTPEEVLASLLSVLEKTNEM